MAKKQQQKLSYGPNLGLVGGAKTLAESEVAKTSAGGQAFAMGLTTTVIAGLEEKKKREDKLDAWMDNLGGIENINLLDQGYNKEAVTDFLRDGRDQYAILAEEFERTKDRAVKDKMDEIKFSFQNLNNQLQGLAKERRDYADAYDKKQLVTLENGDERFVDMYTNQSAFGISANGDIGYVGNDGSYTKFKDVAGKWNVENNLHKTFTLKTNMDQAKMGASGKDFQRDNVKNSFKFNLEETGPDGIMVMAVTDMTGDGKYVVGKDDDGNDIVAEDMSFRSMWSQGFLSDKFYQKFPKNSDPKWMTNKDNVSHLADLISEYNTDVAEFTHAREKQKYDAKQQQKENKIINNQKTRQNLPVNYGGGYITTESADLLLSDIKNKEPNIYFNQNNYKWNESKNTYEKITESNGERIATPISNKQILMEAEIWQQGYRTDDYIVKADETTPVSEEFATPLPKSKTSLGKTVDFLSIK